MDHNKLKFTAKENPSDEEIAELRESLRAYNRSVAGGTTYHNVMHSVRDEDGKLLGGAYGRISWDWMYVELLWVDDSLRGSGAGTKLLRELEQQANKLGVYRYHLSTISFQALGFYKKMGYEVFGEVEDMPPGYCTYFLKKTEL